MADTLRPSAHPISVSVLSQHDARRAGILAAARACFSRSGFHSSSMQEICSEAAMSPGTLYRYFPSKDAIIEAIAVEERSKGQRLVAYLGRPGSIQQRLFSAGLAYINSMRDRSSVQLMLEVCAESLRNSAVSRHFVASEVEIKDLFREAVVEAQHRGEIVTDIEVETALQTLIAFADGLVLRVGLDPDFDFESIVPMLWRVVIAVLGNAPETMEQALANATTQPI